MEEKTKKWSRNTKLVPQEYLDSDDENIAKMQDEIEETMAQMNPLSILSKLEPKKPHKDMESSVKVEVEEVGQNVKEELKHTEDLQDLDLNIKIHSVKSFRESTQDAPNISDDVYDVFNIDEDELREDFESLSQETTSVADKIIEIYLKNTFGKKHLFIAQSRLDQKLQKKLRTWRSWYKSKPQLRDAPLMYICYACNQGWWHFSEFREHLSHCRKWICLNIDMTNYQAMLIATKGRRPKGPKLPTFDSNCWKCNKDGLIHLKSQYVCDGCNTAFPTCTALCFHEGECKMYRKKIFVINGMNVENNLVISYHCLICSYKDWDKDGLIIHIKNVHSVRSDLPIDWTTKVCGRCNLHYHEFTGYHCSLPTSMESCVSCTANFQTLLGLKMHVNNSVDDYKCKLCNKILQKSCMEPEHMLEHTNNYMQLFKCPFCPEPMYFLYEKFAKHHKNSVHQDHLNRMPLWLYGYKVIIPKRLFERLQPIKNKPAQPPAIFDGSNDLDRKNDHHAHIDKYSQDLRDAQEQPDLETPRAPDTRNLIYAENGVEITIINKSVLQELSDAVVAEIKAKEIITEQCKIVTNPEMNIKLPDNETYVNKKISKTDNLADKTEVEVGDIEGKKEIESDNIIKVKEELMETDELDVNIKVKNEVDDGVTNFVDIEVKSESIEEVRTIESYEVEIKQESEDFRDYEPDIISSGDMNSADGTEDAEEDTCHKRRKKANVPYIPKAIFTDKYECTKCNKAWPTFKKYLLHFSVHNYKSRTCPQCLKYCRGSRIKHVFAHVNSLFVMENSIEHLKVPRAQSNYRCKKCKEVLGVKEFFRHWESHLDINDNTVSEPQCPVDMTEKPHLNEMIELLQGHDSSETWKLWHCQVCNKKFQRQNDCKRHYIEHLLADAYQEKRKGVLMCQICGAGFQKTDLYRRHMRDHASLPVYICEICDKTFSDSSNFSKHKKVHNLAVLICDICQKKFKNKSFLIKHIEMHQLVKPINCKKCEKVFYTQSSYRKHLKGNRFTCVICNIVYYSIKEKLDHMWQVHKERKYEADCPLCDKSFRKFQDVKQHLRREHSEDKVRLEQAERAISLKFGTSK